MEKNTFNMGRYIFKLEKNNLFVIDNPVSDIENSMDFFKISKIDGIYNLKSKTNENDFAIAILVNGQFYYRTVDNTPENIVQYKELIQVIKDFR
jgi:hypothetical protein